MQSVSVMKKNVLLLLGVMFAISAEAQSHSFIDTMYVRYEQFDFDAWLTADTIGNRGKLFNNGPVYPDAWMRLGYSDILQYNYTDNPDGVDVVGLSAAIVLDPTGPRTTVPAEYLLLYDAVTDAFDLKAQVQWFEDDTAGRPFFRWIQRTANCNVPSSNGIDTVGGAKIYDFYFDKPITLLDSFYVGGTDHSAQGIYTQENIPFGTGHYVTFRTSSSTEGCYHPSLWKMFHYTDYGAPTLIPLLQWQWRPTTQFMMVLPIISVVDTSFANAPECPRVSGMFLRGNYTDTVTVQWAYDTLHDEFEVSYGRVGTVPDDGTVVTVRDNKWQFADSAYNDTQMVVYVRTVCREYDTLRWSGWSVPMYMCVHYDVDTAQQEGIEVPEEVSDLQRFVRLMPNPASGNVVVMSSYGMERVEVYDARGGRVYDCPAKGTSTGFDVLSWAKGTYVVLVRTPAGTAAKRLVVN